LVIKVLQKVAAAYTRLRTAEDKVEALMAAENPDMKDLEACPDLYRLKVR